MTSDFPPGVRAPRPRLTGQVLIGLMAIAVGVIFTLDNLEIIDARDYLQYWPVALVAVGALKLWHARHDGHGWLGGLIFIGIGSYLLIARIVYFQISSREIFPLFLVFLGGYMVWRGFGGRRRGRTVDGSTRFSGLAVMGGVARRSNSQAFEGADLTAIMGGCEIDLRKASIAPGTEAVIDVFAFWGGIDIKVPEDWTVITRAIPLMGGVEDKTHTPNPPPPVEKRLIISGMVMMGGVVVKN
jgi:predicted membrane protein